MLRQETIDGLGLEFRSDMLKTDSLAKKTPAEIRKIGQEQYGVTYPDDYVEFIAEYAGCTPWPLDYFAYDGAIEGPTGDQIAVFCHFDDGPYSWSVVDGHSFVEDIIGQKVIPFAYTEGSDYLCFDFRNDDIEPDIVIMMLHGGDDPDEIVSHVSKTFTELLEMLDQNP